MDLFLVIILIIVGCIVFSLCGWCCKMKKVNPTVTYTTTTVVSDGTPYITTNNTPYPTHPTLMPMPQGAQAVPIGFSHGPYPPAPYPQQGPGFAYPPPQGTIASTMNQNPPSYAEATTAYAKQSPYNPNYN